MAVAVEPIEAAAGATVEFGVTVAAIATAASTATPAAAWSSFADFQENFPWDTSSSNAINLEERKKERKKE